MWLKQLAPIRWLIKPPKKSFYQFVTTQLDKSDGVKAFAGPFDLVNNSGFTMPPRPPSQEELDDDDVSKDDGSMSTGEATARQMRRDFHPTYMIHLQNISGGRCFATHFSEGLPFDEFRFASDFLHRHALLAMVRRWKMLVCWSKFILNSLLI